eukprot:s194_g29.t1
MAEGVILEFHLEFGGPNGHGPGGDNPDLVSKVSEESFSTSEVRSMLRQKLTVQQLQEHPKPSQKVRNKHQPWRKVVNAQQPLYHLTPIEFAEMHASSASARPKRPGEVEVTSVLDDGEVADSSFLSAMESQVDSQQDPGLSAPVTPPMSSQPLPPTPRQPHMTRTHEDEVDADHESKRAELEIQKKQKINRMMQQNETMIRVVKAKDKLEEEVSEDEQPIAQKLKEAWAA